MLESRLPTVSLRWQTRRPRLPATSPPTDPWRQRLRSLLGTGPCARTAECPRPDRRSAPHRGEADLAPRPRIRCRGSLSRSSASSTTAGNVLVWGRFPAARRETRRNRTEEARRRAAPLRRCPTRSTASRARGTPRLLASCLGHPRDTATGQGPGDRCVGDPRAVWRSASAPNPRVSWPHRPAGGRSRREPGAGTQPGRLVPPPGHCPRPAAATPRPARGPRRRGAPGPRRDPARRLELLRRRPPTVCLST